MRRRRDLQLVHLEGVIKFITPIDKVWPGIQMMPAAPSRGSGCRARRMVSCHEPLRVGGAREIWHHMHASAVKDGTAGRRGDSQDATLRQRTRGRRPPQGLRCSIRVCSGWPCPQIPSAVRQVGKRRPVSQAPRTSVLRPAHPLCDAKISSCMVALSAALCSSAPGRK